MDGADCTLDLELALQTLAREGTADDEAIALLTADVARSPFAPLNLPDRLSAFCTCYPIVQPLCCVDLGWEAVPLLTLWRLWLPLAQTIAQQRQSCGRPIVQGFLGGQGTGKTTLARMLTALLTQMGYGVASLSLDDLYKSFGDRQQLQQADPRLRWRGPPGTHDLDIGLQVVRQVQSGSADPVPLPRFDKALHQGMGDRIAPEVVGAVDILLFEGWFVGVRPVDPQVFETAPPPLVSAGDRAFAQDCNTRLQDYVPLWDALDGLIVLHPVDYRLSKTWRKQAEHDMARQGRSGMSDADIEDFVDYFWKALHPELFWPPLLGDRQRVDWIIDIHPDHTPGTIYRPHS